MNKVKSGTANSETPPLPALSAGVVNRMFSDRISSSHSNAGKKAFLAAHFEEVHALKNQLSDFLMRNWRLWSHKEFQRTADKQFLMIAGYANDEIQINYPKRKKRVKGSQAHETGEQELPVPEVVSLPSDFPFHRCKNRFKVVTPELIPLPVTRWEMQKLYRDIVFPRVKQTYESSQKKTRLICRKQVFDWSGYNARRNYRKSYAKSALADLLNALRWKVFNSEPDLKTKFPDIIRNFPPAIQKQWDYYSAKYGETRLISLLMMLQARFLRNLTAPEFSTGAYMKAAQFNKHSDKPVWHSHWKRDDSNAQYQDWYQFKSPSINNKDSILYLPLAVNYEYHHKDYDIRKEHYVSLNQKGEINIGLSYTDEVILPDFHKVIGIDANIVSNQLADSTGRMVTMDGGQWLDKALPLFERHEAKGTKNLTHQDLRIQQKLNAERDYLIRKMIGESLRFYKDQGITDVIVEQLTFYLGSVGSTMTNKLLRRFRLSTLKRWFREQAHKMGMRVHDLPSAFSSQACECGHVSASNRKKQPVFLCTECGASHNADTHAAGNTERLFHLAADVLLQGGFVTVNEFGEYTCTQKAYKEYSKLKSIYEDIGHCTREVNNDQTHYAYLTGVRDQNDLACKKQSG